MRTHLLFFPALLISGTLAAQTVVVDENFDSYAPGDLIAQTAGAPWTTWSMAPGGSEDTGVSSEQATSGTNSGKWNSTAVLGGPTDMVLDLGGQTTGTWAIAFQMYIPTGKGGYFNILHSFAGATSEWAASFHFLANGTCNAMVNATTVPVSYPHDQWFPVAIGIDLGTSAAAITINESDPVTWPFNTQETGGAGLNQLDAINFFAYAGGADQTTYYIDDVLVVDASGVGVDELNTSGVRMYPNPATDNLTIDASRAQATGLWMLRDATGRKVLEGGQVVAQARQDVSVAHLPAGIYVFELQQNGQRFTQRVVKN